MGFFSFLNNAGVGNLGVGVADLGFQRSQSQPLESVVGTGLFVQRQPGALNHGFALDARMPVPTVDLRANGVYLQGQLVLTALADNKGK